MEQEQEPKRRKEKPEETDATLLLARALDRIADAQDRGGLTKDDLTDVMEKNAEGMRRALKPENARHPDVSAFNPLGERDHPRPKLRRKTFWAGQELHHDELTTTEIDLFNKVEHSLESRNGSWRAELRRTAKDGASELHIVFPCASVDDRMELPGMVLLMQELLGGAQSVDPATLAERVAELEKQLAAR